MRRSSTLLFIMRCKKSELFVSNSYLHLADNLQKSLSVGATRIWRTIHLVGLTLAVCIDRHKEVQRLIYCGFGTCETFDL